MEQKNNAYPRIVYVGAHMESYAPFRRLIQRGENIVGFVTLIPESMQKMSGATDLTGLADNAGIPMLRIKNINSPEAMDWIRALAPDVILVIGWTQLLKDELLRMPKLACLGFHASLLPKYRGRAPINWALIYGEKVTGNSMITLEPEADTGDIVAQREIPITDEDDCNTLYQKVGQTEVEMLEAVLPQLRKGIVPRTKQDNSIATVMPKRRPEDGIIDWNRSSRELYNWVRAVTEPYPGAFSFVNGEKVFVWKAQIANDAFEPSQGVGEVRMDREGWPVVSTTDGWLRLVSVQKEGGVKVSGQQAAKTFLGASVIFTGQTEKTAGNVAGELAVTAR
jgi:methionyl-tRNA formyltransferase